MKVFVSSSLRNEQQAQVVEMLRFAGHEVYDFRNPSQSPDVFSWNEFESKATVGTAEAFRQLLEHPRVEEAFKLDMEALRECDVCLMVQPCGRSAALELGWAAGAGKPTVVLLADGEPELMLKMATHFCLNLEEVLEILRTMRSDGAVPRGAN